ncbi:MAG: TatD family hydrolase [Candidatus Dojkabacteria bacterium]|nr:TatD family hydrolase [Candidatus Dojkabacteria bacterium]
MIDAHAHIASSPKSYPSVSELIKRAKDAGVSTIVDAAIDLDTSQAVLKLHKEYPEIIIPTIGLQPELLIPGSDIYDRTIASVDSIKGVLEKVKNQYTKGEGKYKAVGECGLDYYWLEKSEQLTAEQRNSSKDLQEALFRRQIEFAGDVRLPLVVHSRGAEAECLSMINDQLPMIKLRALFHSFTGDLKTAEAVWKSGHYISFNGIITYSRAQDIREIFKFGWERYREQILAETDSPYLIPSNRKKLYGQDDKTSEPADVRWVVGKMAGLTGISLKEMDSIINKNTIRFYDIQC